MHTLPISQIRPRAWLLDALLLSRQQGLIAVLPLSLSVRRKRKPCGSVLWSLTRHGSSWMRCFYVPGTDQLIDAANVVAFGGRGSPGPAAASARKQTRLHSSRRI